MIEAAILGLGHWGTVLVNAVNGRSEAIRFTRAVVRSPEKHADIAARQGLEVGSDYDAVLADPSIQAVVIATPNTQHVDQCLRAAAAGKHILCDKPFTVTLDEAQRVMGATAQAGVACVVGFQRRFLAPYAEIRRRMEAGELGRVHYVEANQSAPAGLHLRADNWRTQPNEFRGGGIGAHGIHMVDAMIGLFGPIAAVDAQARRHVLEIDIQDTTTVEIEFANGMTGYVGTLLATAPTHRFQVFGDQAWAEMRDHRRFELRPVQGEAKVIDFPAPTLERAELECFAGMIRGEASFPVSSQEALHGQAVFDAVAESVERGGRVVLPQ